MIAYARWVGATYVFTTVDVPHATFTTLWGVNNVGQAAADAIIAGNYYGLVHENAQWNPLAVPPPGFSVYGIGINDFNFGAGGAVPSGAITPEQGFILNRGTATYT